MVEAPPIQLSAAETEVAKAAARGALAEPAGPDGSAVRPLAIAALCWGRPVLLDGATEPAQGSVHATGLRLRGFHIAGGPLDLANIAVAGDAFPPLELHACVIPGTIMLAGARLRHLSLRGSKVGHLDASGAMFGSVDADEVGAPDPDGGGCRLHFGNAIVAGNLSLRRARLVSRTAGSGRTASALDLAGARIRGTLDLSGASLTGVLRADNAHIQGNAWLRAWPRQNGWERFEASAPMAFRMARIDGELDLRGARIGGLDASDIAVGGSARLGVVDVDAGADGRSRPFRRFRSRGRVTLDGARIGQHLDVSGASLGDLFQADRAEIGGNLNFGMSWEGDGRILVSRGGIHLREAKVGGDLVVQSALLGHRKDPPQTRRKESKFDAAGIAVQGVARFSPAVFRGPRGPRVRSQIAIQMPFARMRGLEMRGACLSAGLDAQFASVSGSVLLCRFDDGDDDIPLLASGGRTDTLALRGIKIGGDLLLGGAVVDGALCLADAEIDGSVAFNDTQRYYTQPGIGHTPPGRDADCRVDKIDLQDCRITNDLSLRRLAPCKSTSGIEVNLTNAQVGCLRDEHGRGWGERLKALKLSGFRYRSFSNSIEDSLPTGHGKAEASRSHETSRSDWLRRQFPGGKPTRATYSPGPYQRAAAAFRADGEFDAAERMIFEKMKIERGLKRNPIARALSFLFHHGFGYGLSPARAAGTFAGSILIGIVGVWKAQEASLEGANKPVLVVEATAMQGAVISKARDDGGGASPPYLVEQAGAPRQRASLAFARLPNGDAWHEEELPCGTAIDPVLYAIDIFLPVLELHQQSRCSVSAADSALGWRLARLAYSVLGAVITFLTLLTVSGVLRRHLERTDQP